MRTGGKCDTLARARGGEGIYCSLCFLQAQNGPKPETVSETGEDRRYPDPLMRATVGGNANTWVDVLLDTGFISKAVIFNQSEVRCLGEGIDSSCTVRYLQIQIRLHPVIRRRRQGLLADLLGR